MDRPAPVTVEIPSDDDDDCGASSFPPPRKKRALEHGVAEGRVGGQPPSPLLVLIDDEPTPLQSKKPRQDRTPSFVPETPNPPSSPPILASDATLVRCSLAPPSDYVTRRRQPYRGGISGIAGLIFLESDHESSGASPNGSPVSLEDCVSSRSFQFPDRGSPVEYVKRGMPTEEQGSSGDNELHETRYVGITTPPFPDVLGTSVEQKEDGGSHFFDGTHGQTLQGNATFGETLGNLSSDDNCLTEVCIASEVHDDHDKENIMLEQVNSSKKQKRKGRAANADKRTQNNEEFARTKKEEKLRLNEEKQRRKQEEKLQKEVLKAEAAELKKLQKEKQKWEAGKFATKSIVAEIDTKVIENGSIGGHLLTRFAEKALAFRVTKNPIEGSILWKMSFPDQISQLSSVGSDVPYVLLVYEAEEFCNLLTNECLLDHVCGVQHLYPSFTICYLTNRLSSYISKREQSQYKNPSNFNSWRRPPLDEVLSKLVTHFSRVHSRQCMDEAEVADHVVGLTYSLATCQFRKKLTRLSVNSNGSQIPKGSIDKNTIKRNVWLKALVSIPKVQPRFAIAISKKYPTMRSLLNVYLDPNKSVHEKEFLLKDLIVEEVCREERRIGEVCSKRVYRILMARNGGMKTEDVEVGADFFSRS